MLNIIFFIVSILLVIYSVYALKHTHKINKNIDKENQILEELHQELNQTLHEIQEDITKKDIEYEVLRHKVNDEKEKLDNIQSNISKTLDNQKELSQKAFENYCEVLETRYKEYEQEYDQYKDALEISYSNRQLELMREMDEVQVDLNKIKETRTAALQAQTREKEIEEQLSFYCLQASDNDLKDIAVLESVKVKLTNPRILSMLIWQTYWRTPMTNLCNNVIGKDTKTGIYKITNQKTKECYIGQAVDLASRWKDHAKCGLGIDTPAGNKLYKAIQDFGIWNFSWEVLEICPRDQLNEKEKYYIGLYDSKNFGYNSTSGNK